MGQYYHAVNIDTMQWLYSHDYHDGSKLMEHSYLNNTFVGAAMQLLSPGNPWHKCRFVWAGDYGEKKLCDFVKTDAEYVTLKLDGDAEPNLYGACEQSNRVKPKIITHQARWVVVNHTKKEYVRLNALPEDNRSGFRIHPLPLLTSDGNGNGGGDYSGTCMELVGSWAGDVISVELDIPDGMVEIMSDEKFSEDE